MDELVIREYEPETTPADLDAVLPGFLEIWNAPQNLPYLTFTMRRFEPAQVRGWLERHRTEGVRWFGAADAGGRVAALGALRLDPVQGAEIIGMGTRPEDQRRGAGRRLVERMAQAAREEGYRALDAAVFADNAAMLRLLLSLRFVPVHMEPRRRADGADLVHLRAPL